MGVALTAAPPTAAPTIAEARQRGFSLVEALIAAFLLVLVVLALVPLFSTAIGNTLAGRELSVASQHGRSRIEEAMQLPLDRPAVNVPAGADERVDREVLERGAERWRGGTASDPVPWTRVTVVRQYNVRDLYESGRLTDRLDGGTDPGHVHLREVFVEVEVERDAASPLAGGREVVLSTVRGF